MPLSLAPQNVGHGVVKTLLEREDTNPKNHNIVAKHRSIGLLSIAMPA